jgi:cytoskeletal protein RodZ
MTTPSFGEKLRRERESRNTSIEEIAERTKIALRFLQALERDEFDELPGRAFGKFYIRAYAEVLRFDPEPLIAEYDREQAVANGSAVETAALEPAKPRRMEAQIARWREARNSRQRTPTEEVEEPEPAEEASEEAARIDADRATIVQEIEADEDPTPTEEQAREPAADESAHATVFDQEPDVGVARYDEAAALASILGAQVSNPESRIRRRNIWAVVVVLGLVVAFTWAFIALSEPREGAAEDGQSVTTVESRGPATSGSLATDEATTNAVGEPESVVPPAPRPTVDPPRAAPESATRNSADSTPPPARLTVSESGVGRRIVNRSLEGRGDRFEEGEVVWFQTRVVGGSRGEIIRHVWLRDGGSVQTVDLELGGAHWRTHSRKTLWGTGEWTVEARDRNGTVLARARFVCVPASR